MANFLEKQISGGGLISPSTLRSFLRSQPAYSDNRERAAVVLDQGFKAWDAYVKAKPYLFAGSLVGLVGSVWMLKRRRKTAGEAVALWTTSALACAAVAFITRPTTGAVAPPVGASAKDKADIGVIAAIDRKRDAMRREDRNFADKVFQRLVDMPGVREQLNAQPLVKAAVI